MDEKTHRACVACDEIYYGGLSCPACGEPGEPLEIPVSETKEGWRSSSPVQGKGRVSLNYVDEDGQTHTVH